MSRKRTRSRGRQRVVTVGRVVPLVLLVAAVVAAGAVPTGSFSTVQSPRSGTVGVAGDDAAALGLDVSPTVTAGVQESLVTIQNDFPTGSAVVTVTLADPARGTLHVPGDSGDSVTVTIPQDGDATVEIDAAATAGPFEFEVVATVAGETTTTLTRQSVVELGQVPVDIDIKPDSHVNPINPDSHGVIPVAVLQTPSFDPTTQVDVGSLRFGAPDVVDAGSGAQPAHGGHYEDVDGDGDTDLVLHFPTQDAGFDGDDDAGKLVGETPGGTPLSGSDSVTIVGGGDDDCDGWWDDDCDDDDDGDDDDCDDDWWDDDCDDDGDDGDDEDCDDGWGDDDCDDDDGDDDDDCEDDWWDDDCDDDGDDDDCDDGWGDDDCDGDDDDDGDDGWDGGDGDDDDWDGGDDDDDDDDDDDWDGGDDDDDDDDHGWGDDDDDDHGWGDD